jgi:hypothetical protein
METHLLVEAVVEELTEPALQQVPSVLVEV